MASAQKLKKLIVVGTTNKLKVEAIASCYDSDIYLIHGLKEFKSSVSEYPVGKNETYQGALYRAKYAYTQYPNADLCIGVESGFLYENCDTIPIQQVDVVNVIVSIVILSKNVNSKQFNEISLWSEILQCPITSQQRYDQIANPIKNLKKQYNDKSNQNEKNMTKNKLK